MNIFPLIAIGSGSINQNGDLLDVRYHLIVNKENQELHNKLEFNYGSYNNLESLLSNSAESQSQKEALRKELSLKANKKLIIHQISNDEAIRDIRDSYLKLHLLSLRISKPNALNLEGIFANSKIVGKISMVLHCSLINRFSVSGIFIIQKTFRV